MPACYLEARLPNIARGLPGTPEINFDIKGRLLRLRSALGQHVQPAVHGTRPSAFSRQGAQSSKRLPCLPKQSGVSGPLLERLFATIETAVQRIEARQLRSLAGGADDSFTWHVELPFLYGDRVRTVELVIERNGSDSGAEAVPVWTARLTLDVDGLGMVHARVTLTGEAVAVKFWVAQSATLASLTARTESLVHALSRLGLSVSPVRYEQGMPSDCPDGAPCLIQAHA